MEIGRRVIDVHLRAVEGFPDEIDQDFDPSDPSYAIVELIVRRIPLEDATGGARYLCLRRSLADFVHLESRLLLDDASCERALQSTNITQLIQRYATALARPRFGFIANENERLLVQLETALITILLSPSRRSIAVKQFFGYASLSGEQLKPLVDKCLHETDSIEDEVIVGGESLRHAVDVQGESLVVWKFAYAGDAVDLAVAYTPRNEEDEASAKDVETEHVDPYSEAAWNVRESPSPQNARDRLMLQYSTRYVQQERDQDSWIYGACRVPTKASGVVTLEWKDVGEASIFAKPLRFQTKVYRSDGVTLHDKWTPLFKVLADESEDQDEAESLAWLDSIVEASMVTTWPTAVTDNEELLEKDHVVDARATFSSDTARLRETQNRELERKVFQLEEELQAVRQDLKTTKSELDISSEIYKASLEMISHLETTPSHSQRNGGPNHRVAVEDATERDSLGGADQDDADSYGDDERKIETDDDEDEADGETTDGETTRLRGLVATFQEQCLWRSIETSESEKRNLLLEVELNQLDRDKHLLVEKLATRDQELALYQAENQKLRAQKTVLVKEVKRLQPYSQVNLSALIREAEEARMMQRSLQAQLQALAAGNTPETDHPIAQAATENGDR